MIHIDKHKEIIKMEVCTLASGSSGNCTYISADGFDLLIDAGISMRRIKHSLDLIGKRLDCVSAILITHEHSDHIGALKMIDKYYQIPVFVPAGAKRAIAAVYPEISDRVTEFEIGSEIRFGALTAVSFPTPHDASASVGYKLTCGGKSFVVATDMGYITKNIYNAACGADFAMIEANHDPEMLRCGIYPYHLKQRIASDRGHLSNSECGRLCAALAKEGTRHFLLAHLSRNNNTPELAFAAAKAALENEGFALGKDVFVDVAPSDDMTARYII